MDMNNLFPDSSSLSDKMKTAGFSELVKAIEGMLNMHLSSYKEDYIKRRLLSRMNSTRTTSYRDYHQYLLSTPEEKEKLRNALTINVTKFFRDLGVFDLVRKEIFPEILNKKQNLHLWSAGCSSGEEPYTYAIILYELNKLKRSGSVITATDIDDTILKKAKEGIYEKTALENMQEAQISRHFTLLEDGRYSIKPHIREMVRFSHHDLMKGVPVSRFNDVVSCRNVTIYFNEDQKRNLIRLIYEGLVDGGYYIMGMSEYLARDMDMYFTPYRPMLKVFKKTEKKF